MYCQNCGKEIPNGSHFCDGCGAPVSEKQILESAYQYSTKPVNQYTQNVNRVGNVPAAPAKPVTKRWPAVCGVMSVLYLLFFLLSLVFLILYYTDSHMPVISLLAARIIPIILAIAVPVLFFTPTKKLAFLTAIPMFLNLIFAGINTFSMLRYTPAQAIIQNLVDLGFLLILAVFYIIQMTARPRSAALPVLYLIFSILHLITYAILEVRSLALGYMPAYVNAVEIATFISQIFLTVAYCAAMFSSRRR